MKNRVLRHWLFTTPFVVIAGLSSPTAAGFDDFDGSEFLLAERWTTPEVTNLVNGGVLLSAVATQGRSASSDARPVDPSSVQAISAVARVTGDSGVGDSARRVRLAGFFCDSNNSADGDNGEIFAETAILSRGAGAREFRYLVSRCDNAQCSASTTLLDQRFGNPQLNAAHTLVLSFDPATRVFSFSIDGGSTRTFGPADASVLQNCGSSNNPFKTIGTRVSIDDASQSGTVAATFDDVRINGNPFDDFSAGVLDPVRWRDREVRVEIEAEGANNVLRVVQRRTGSAIPYHLGFADPNTINGMRADLRVDSATINATDGNGEVRARISGTFFNDGATSGPGDQTGDVFVQLRLQRRLDSGQTRFSVECLALRSDDPTFTTDTELFRHDFSGASWTEGRVYNLLLAFDPATKTFHCGFGQQQFSYPLKATDPQPAQTGTELFKSLGTRIDGVDGAGERAEISVVFDNVRITPARLSGDELFRSSFEKFTAF